MRCILARWGFFCYNLFQHLPHGRGCPSKSSKFAPALFHMWDSGCHLLGPCLMHQVGCWGRGSSSPLPRGEARLRRPPERSTHHHPGQYRSAMLQPLHFPLNPRGCDLWTGWMWLHSKRPPHCELNMWNIGLAWWGSQLWDIHSS